jgi:hypothetical protein
LLYSLRIGGAYPFKDGEGCWVCACFSSLTQYMPVTFSTTMTGVGKRRAAWV